MLDARLIICAVFVVFCAAAAGCSSAEKSDESAGRAEELRQARIKLVARLHAHSEMIQAETRQFIMARGEVKSVGRVELTPTSVLILGKTASGRRLSQESQKAIRGYLVEKYKDIGIMLDPLRVQLAFGR